LHVFLLSPTRATHSAYFILLPTFFPS
jgi:hypothetical protein